MIALHPVFVGPTLGTGLVSSLDNSSSMTVDAVVSPSAHMRAQVICGAYMGISMQVSGTIASTIRGRVTAGATLSNVPRPELSAVVRGHVTSDASATLVPQMRAAIESGVTIYAHVHTPRDIYGIISGGVDMTADADQVRIPHLSAGISGNVDVACDVSGADVDSLVARVAGIVDVDVAADKIIITALHANVQDGVRVDVTCGRVDTLPDQESRLVGSVSDARIVVARAYRPRHVFEKRAADTVRYAVDWRQWLLSDRISASDWIVYSNDLHIVAQDVVGRVTRIAIGGGTPDTVYPVTNRVTTDGGQVISRTVHLYILPTVH